MKEPKPFDLEAAKRGEPIMFRDGTPCKFVAHVPEAHDWDKIVILVAGAVLCRNVDGTLHGYDDTSPRALVMAPKRRTVYVNLHRNTNADWFHNAGAAKHCALEDDVAIAIPVEIEE